MSNRFLAASISISSFVSSPLLNLLTKSAIHVTSLSYSSEVSSSVPGCHGNSCLYAMLVYLRSNMVSSCVFPLCFRLSNLLISC